jgi:hypothetical protein
MNAHLFLFGPTGSGKSATLNNILNQVTAIYRPRLFIVEAGNSFGLFGDFAARLGLTVHRVKLAPGGHQPRAVRRRPPAGRNAQPGADAMPTPWTKTATRRHRQRMRTSSATCWANWRSPRG